VHLEIVSLLLEFALGSITDLFSEKIDEELTKYLFNNSKNT